MNWNIRTIIFCFIFVLLLSACQSVGDNTERHGAITATEKKLSYGVLSYEEGDYSAATAWRTATGYFANHHVVHQHLTFLQQFRQLRIASANKFNPDRGIY